MSGGGRTRSERSIQIDGEEPDQNVEKSVAYEEKHCRGKRDKKDFYTSRRP